MVAYTIRRSDGMGERLIECQWWISGAECVNDGLWRRWEEETGFDGVDAFVT